MIISTLEQVAGYQVTESLGVVTGNTIRARHLGKILLPNCEQLLVEKLRNIRGCCLIHASNPFRE